MHQCAYLAGAEYLARGAGRRADDGKYQGACAAKRQPAVPNTRSLVNAVGSYSMVILLVVDVNIIGSRSIRMAFCIVYRKLDHFHGLH